MNGQVRHSNPMVMFSMKYRIGRKATVERSEVSRMHNHASLACRHNLQYWRGLPYLAFGAGAHGYANGYRYSNVLRIKTYIDRLTNYQLPIINFPSLLQPSTITNKLFRDDMSEFMMTGLRLTQEGVCQKRISGTLWNNPCAMCMGKKLKSY